MELTTRPLALEEDTEDVAPLRHRISLLTRLRKGNLASHWDCSPVKKAVDGTNLFSEKLTVFPTKQWPAAVFHGITS